MTFDPNKAPTDGAEKSETPPAEDMFSFINPENAAAIAAEVTPEERAKIAADTRAIQESIDYLDKHGRGDNAEIV